MEYKNWFIKFLFLFCLIFLLSTLLNYFVDPYQIYHKNKFGFLPNERYQVAGLIENYLADDKQKLDSIIIGTSMSQNFIPQDVTDNLQFEGTLKLTISGSSPAEDRGLITLQNIDDYENNFIKNLIDYKIYTSSDSCDRYKVEPQNYE